MKSKMLGQVFTPKYIVNEILDNIDFRTKNILNKKIIDNSAGDGAFIISILKRIIHQGKENNLDNNEILRIIKKNVYAIEIDHNAYLSLINKTKKLIFKELSININKEEFNFINGDTFEEYKKLTNFFDYVVGNPPYIRVHNLNKETLQKMKQMQFLKSGMIDIYIAFFEMGIKMLNNNGKLGYITPNSFFTSKSGKFFREYILENNILYMIIDQGHKQHFENITTYSAITIIDKNKKIPIFKIKELHGKIKKVKKDAVFPPEYKKSKNDKIVVKNGFATLNDSFFIGDYNLNNKDTIRMVKASSCHETIGFYPYNKDLSKKTWNQLDYETQKYIISANKKNNWHYGRSQALIDTYKEKIAIQSLIHEDKKIKYKKVKRGVGIFGGLYILNANEDHLNILSSRKFKDFVKSLKKYKNGGYYTFNSSELQWFLNNKI